MEDKSYKDIDEDLKKEEIRRLTDLNQRGFFNRNIEPRKGILTDDEVLKYAGDSKLAAKIRLKRGISSFHDDKLAINWDFIVLSIVSGILLSVPFIFYGLGRYFGDLFIVYLIFFIVVPIISERRLVMWAFSWIIMIISYILFSFIEMSYINSFLNEYTLIAIGFIILLFSFFIPVYILFIKSYQDSKYEKQQNKQMEETPINDINLKPVAVPFYNVYKKMVIDLNELYDFKEKMLIELIEKYFDKNSITYDRFNTVLTMCNDVFYNHYDSVLSIIESSSDDNPKSIEEIEDKINTLKFLIKKIDDLANELMVNLTSSKELDNQELQNLTDEMDILMKSIKDYK